MTDRRELFRHASIYSIASILGKAIGFVMLPLYAHAFHTEGYGVIAMIDTPLGLILTLLGYGMGGGLVRIYNEEPEPGRNRVIPTLVLALWGIGLTVALLSASFGNLISWALCGDGRYSTFVVMAAVTFVLDLTGQAASTLLLVKQRSISFATVGLVRLTTGLTLNIVLIVALGWGLTGYFASALVSAGVASLAFHIFLLRESPLRFDPGVARRIAAFELPLVPGNLLSFVSRQIERVVVRIQIGIGSAGVLEFSYKFAPLIALLVIDPFMQTWHPKRTSIAGDPGSAIRIGRVFTDFLFVVTFAALVLSVNMRALFEIIAPREFWHGVGIAQVEVGTMWCTACYYQAIFGLYYTKKTHRISVIKGTVSVVKILLSYTLIRSFGLGGAAYSALVATLIQTIWTWIESQRVFPAKFEYSKIACIVATALVVFSVLQFVDLRDTRFVVATKKLVVTEATGVASNGDLRLGGHAIADLPGKVASAVDIGFETLLCASYLAIWPLLRSRRAEDRELGVSAAAG
jgi:O-antigen/teichoic acid export membrane protein